MTNLSQCCHAPLEVSTADEGTSCYICSKCHNSSDPKFKGINRSKKCLLVTKKGRVNGIVTIGESRLPAITIIMHLLGGWSVKETIEDFDVDKESVEVMNELVKQIEYYLEVNYDHK